MAQGEMFVGSQASGYAIRSVRDGKPYGPNYTTKEGFATEQDAQDAGRGLAAIVGPDFEVVANVPIMIRGRQGRKPKAQTNGQVQTVTPTEQTTGRKPATAATAGTKS